VNLVHDDGGELEAADAVDPDEDVEPSDDIEPGDIDVDLEALRDTGDPIDNALRRRGGVGGVIAAGMFGLEQAMFGKVKPESVQVQESPSEPTDVDKDGIVLTLAADVAVQSPALERKPPIGLKKRKLRRR
jgi:hypothetical protein